MVTHGRRQHEPENFADHVVWEIELRENLVGVDGLLQNAHLVSLHESRQHAIEPQYAVVRIGNGTESAHQQNSGQFVRAL